MSCREAVTQGSMHRETAAGSDHGRELWLRTSLAHRPGAINTCSAETHSIVLLLPLLNLEDLNKS